MTKKEYVSALIERLKKEYPEADCTLITSNPLQLLISTQLSAQCTDERVNIVTKELYKKYHTAEDFASATVPELEECIKSLGLYKNKAKNLKSCCETLVRDFNGEVPDTMEQLLTLAGVGRKTANLVLGEAFGKPAVVVDTHAGRLSRRMGLTKNTDPVKIEMELKKLIPPEEQMGFCHRLVHHGRKYCTARKPYCDECPLNGICKKIIEKKA
ncbi:MAG: endonuclease III [Clostridia bacterium]|nr:endonuclease III [Clostridia bacterium]